jgi:hypothetical protein
VVMMMTLGFDMENSRVRGVMRDSDF